MERAEINPIRIVYVSLIIFLVTLFHVTLGVLRSQVSDSVLDQQASHRLLEEDAQTLKVFVERFFIVH